MIPVISVVGKSDSGKTGFIEAIIPLLSKEGLKVATIKHDVHGFDIDKPGKDTWRHKQSGADMVLISSPDKIAIIRDVEEEYNLDQLRSQFVSDIDLILTEGYKREDKPKIETYRPKMHDSTLCDPEEDNLIATVINSENSEGVASFAEEDLKEIVDLICNKYINEGNDG